MQRFIIPTDSEIKERQEKFMSCTDKEGIPSADSTTEDISQIIYNGLYKIIEKPESISDVRFEKILEIHAKIFNIFIYQKTLVNSILDDLEKDCASNFQNISDPNELLSKNLCPKKYIFKKKELYHGRRGRGGNNYYDVEFIPVITSEIISGHSDTEYLTQALNQQLQKYYINIALGKEALLSDGWTAFFGNVPFEKAINYIKKGLLFIDPVGYADKDSRFHGPYSHAIQEYVISKLFERGHFDTSVPDEADITPLELFKSNAWEVKHDNKAIERINGYYGVNCLWDIMRETRDNKYRLLNFYPKSGMYGFTSADFVHQYLMVNPLRYPSLSHVLYSMFAKDTFEYFSSNKADFGVDEKGAGCPFDKLDAQTQLKIMNYYSDNADLANEIPLYDSKHPGEYILVEKTSDESEVRRKKARPSIFSFSRTLDDSKSYINARQKISNKAAMDSIFTTRKISTKKTLDDSVLLSGTKKDKKR